MFCILRKKKKYPTYVTKHNSNREKQVILTMIPNREGWHYLAVKNLSALLRGITFKCHDDFYCLNYLKVCENKNFCNVIVPSKDNKILEFNQCQKSDKQYFFIYVDLDCIMEKIDRSKTNPENSSTTKVSKHIPSGF